MRYWQLASGNYDVREATSGIVFDLGDTNTRVIENEVKNHKHKMICLNDTDNVTNADNIKTMLFSVFNQKFPEKSSYEI